MALLSVQAASLAFAQAQPPGISTLVTMHADPGKGFEFRGRVKRLLTMVKDRQFERAQVAATKLQADYEALFDVHMVQYSFASRAEFKEFSRTAPERFEWIDWGYKECLQVQMFMAAESGDLITAIDRSGRIASLAPTSASTAVEYGYVLNRVARWEEALEAYSRARALAQRFVTQRPYLAISMRGMGFTLIELGRLDEAEQVLKESLQVEPGNPVALTELDYIRRLRDGAK